ncbi:MAG: NAD-dependent epimerase/dehydratase family protein [Pseudomonadota bacterium]
MRILITGSAGYLGSKLVTKLKVREDVQIFGIDVKKPPNEKDYELFVLGSVVDQRILQKLFEAAQADIAIHLAFAVNPLHDEKKEVEIDIKGSEFFLEGCRKHQVKKVIFMSSAAAYGAHPDSRLPYTEDSPVRGNDSYIYSRLKAATDRIAHKFAQENPACKLVLLRPCLFLGPNTSNSFFEVLKFPFFPQILDASGRRDPGFQFIHEEDMASCMLAAIDKNVQGDFNIAPDDTVKLSEIAKMAHKRCLAMPLWLLQVVTFFLWKCHLIGAPPGQLDFMRYSWVMDNSKLKKELYQPQYSSSQALREFLDAKK